MPKLRIGEFNAKVENRLNRLSKLQQVRFAWMCAVRALPLLCYKKSFAFWGRQSQIHLRAVFYAHDICMAHVCNIELGVDAMFVAANAAADAAYIAYATANAVAYATDAAANAAIAAADVVDIVDAADADAIIAADAADAATNAVKAANACALDIQNIILEDLHIIASSGFSSQFNNDTTIYGAYWRNFIDALNANGCAYWAKHYTALFANNFTPNKKELTLRLAIPNAIRAEGAAAIAKEMERLAKQKLVQTKEARIILLGTKGAGKTSLATKLHDPEASMPRKSKSTPGVDTSKLDLIPGETTHLWDFGGHVIAQAAHKCFMSAECVYVLVIDGRTEQQLDIDEHRKWLATVKTYSQGGAKVFVFVNKTDRHHLPMPESKLIDEFPNLIEGFYYINIKKDKPALQEFKNDLKNHIETTLVRNVPAQYFKIKEELEQQFKEHNKDVLTEAEVEAISSAFEHANDKQDVLSYFNTLGVALRYDNVPGIVLNPSWISNGIYTIINQMQNDENITIHKDDIAKLFKGKKDAWRYDVEKCELLYTLMQKYELAFEMSRTTPNTLFVPSIRRNKPTKLSAPKPEEETLVCKFNFSITLADNIFPIYIHRHHECLEKINGHYIFRHDGMSLKAGKTYAMVTKDTREIEITVWGENPSALINQLHASLTNLLQEYHIKCEKEEVKLPEFFIATDAICQMYKDGTKKIGKSKVADVIKKYMFIENLINIKNLKIAGLANFDASASLFSRK